MMRSLLHVRLPLSKTQTSKRAALSLACSSSSSASESAYRHVRLAAWISRLGLSGLTGATAAGLCYPHAKRAANMHMTIHCSSCWKSACSTALILSCNARSKAEPYRFRKREEQTTA